MRITDIDIIPIYPRLAKRNAAHNAHYPDWNVRTVFRVKTDNGLTGYGDYRCQPPPSSAVEPLIGNSPFDFMANDFNPGLGGALYDVMGKHLEVPAHKLMGQKVRDWVSVAAWTKPASPEKLREEVPRAVAEGYTVMKMHTCEFYDVFEQNRAVEEVAPEGFRVHYDFNGNRSLVTVLPILKELEKSRVVGFVEDPLRPDDLDGWRRLREQNRIPLIMHSPRLGGTQEILLGAADAYMSNGLIGNTLRRAGACAGANIPLLLQVTGGILTKALALHLASVIPTCTMHSVNLDDQYEDDIVSRGIPVVEGSSPVPDGPGLGIEVDEVALARLAANPPTPVLKHVAIVHLAGGNRICYPSLTLVDVQRMTGREEGTIRGLRLELWDDDGSGEFARIYGKVQKEGPFVE